MNTSSSRHRSRIRGISLLEALISASLTAAVLGIAIGLYARGTRGFYQEQAQAYVQSGARVSLDTIARDARAAKAFESSLVVNGVSYTADNGTSDSGCLILQVPAQDRDDMSLIYQSGTQGTVLVLDKVVYYYNASDGTLCRTVEPGDAQSFRDEVTGAVMSANVSGLRYRLYDRDGVTTTTAGRVAAIDVSASLAQTTQGAPASAVALTGVRLRNMRSGGIRGILKRNGEAVADATVQAVFSSDSGAYATGANVGSPATSGQDGSFEVFGLDPGTYTLEITSTGTESKSGFEVPDEDVCDAGIITLQ